MRYIIADEDHGIFLGTKRDMDNDGIGMLFSAYNFLELTNAVSWPTYEEAEMYLNRYVKPQIPTAFIGSIYSDTKTAYVSVIDICRSGYGDVAAEMVDAIPMENSTIH